MHKKKIKSICSKRAVTSICRQYSSKSWLFSQKTIGFPIFKSIPARCFKSFSSILISTDLESPGIIRIYLWSVGNEALLEFSSLYAP